MDMVLGRAQCACIVAHLCGSWCDDIFYALFYKVVEEVYKRRSFCLWYDEAERNWYRNLYLRNQENVDAIWSKLEESTIEKVVGGVESAYTGTGYISSV